MKFNFDVAEISKIGGRDYNQDYLGHELSATGGCFVVCDGLGAYKGSEDASRLAVEGMLAHFRAEKSIDSDTVKNHIQSTYGKIIAYKKKHPQIRSSCTTLASVIVSGRDITIAHIGDTRCYYFKEGKIVSYTIDHSMSQHAVNIGEITREQIRKHEDRNKLLRVLGGESEPNPDIREITEVLSGGDCFLLCTDGFWEYVTEEDMEDALRRTRTASEWIETMEKHILKRAGKYNDNYSAIAVKITAEGE